jgi:photosystem II stability/assembly factor-like uncharacterized protein
MNQVKFIISSIILFFSISIYPQSGWFWQNPLPQGNDLRDICFNELTGTYFACGAYGTIVNNSIGNIWTHYNANTKEALFSICFKGTHGWAVGSNGTIMHSADGVGVAWLPQESNTNKSLLSVFFLDGQKGWVVGAEHTILHTSDGGQNWEVQMTGGNTHLHSVYFLNESIGYACGYDGAILKTTNGGSFWQGQNTPTFNRLRSIYFKDENNGVAVGEHGTALYTTDAGVNWNEASSKTENDLMDAYYDEEGNGFAVGDSGTVIYTNDLGKNWYVQYTETKNLLYGIARSKIAGQSGIILRSISGGSIWEKESSGFYDWLNGVDFLDENNGWVVGTNGTIYQTTNGGNNWIKHDKIQNWKMGAPLSEYNLHAVDFISPNAGYAVGEYGLVLKYINSWDIAIWTDKHILTNNSLNAVHRRSGVAWVAGDWGSIWRTDDYGDTWNLQHQSNKYNLYAIHFVSKNYGWAAGMSGTVLRTKDGGDTWIDVSPDNLSFFRSIFFIDLYHGWVVGVGGIIYRTVDGGETWIKTSPQVTYNLLWSVYFVDEYTGWICGTNGTILHTTDGGENWYFQDSHSNGDLTSMKFTDNGIGWIVGFEGVILKTLDGGGELLFDVYNKYDLNIPILDLVKTSDVMTIGSSSKLSKILENNILSGITVMLDTIIHPHIADLTITLSHNGISDTLFFQAGGDSADIINCTLSDASSVSIVEGEAPFSTNYKPHEPLSVFNGLNPIGDWTLSVYDGTEGNTGTLKSWGLKFYFDKATDVKSEMQYIPKEFVLSQNYPNPFNPTTKIKYSIPNTRSPLLGGAGGGLVTLIVYDVLGRKVATLVNENKQPGEYKVEFNAKNLTSGVYFYQLRAGGFTSTKKMVVIK